MSDFAQASTSTAVGARPEVTPFFDEPSNTMSYVVRDPSSKSCAIVDSVMDLDYPSGSISFDGANRIIDYIRENGLELEWILETHVHADHLSAATYIRNRLGGSIAIGSNISVVQETFGQVFNDRPEFARDATLGIPTVILPSLQVNMRAGHLPLADDNGQVFLKLPINAFGGDDVSELKS
jgi:glyoxylase-like metal-dependent hydrolase (beta-lactamase superfamily II)